MATTLIFTLTIITVLSPLVGAFLSLVLKYINETIRDIAGVLSIAISAIMAVIIFSLFDGSNQSFDFNWFSWTANYSTIQSGFYLDSLSVLMTLIVSILSMLIAFFSLEYMAEDKYKTRYWFFLQLFVFGMLLLVLAHDMIFLFLGWEIVGLCSCFLIAHKFTKEGEEGRKAALSGIKALIMTGIGDVGLLVFLSWAYLKEGTLFIHDFQFSNPPVFMSILLILAPLTKSAQFPLQSWLSSGDTIDIDAMHGPTTVSALIHAATMVKAGVYLVARFSPYWNEQVFYTLLMIIASLSAFLAALGALVTTDIKRVLAYSTISQLSYMFMALSMHEAGLEAGELHLFSHAIFKALLFLAAGAIIHSLADERNMLKMGGLYRELPWVYGFTLTGALALMGLPFITNGGYSKEMIIAVAYHNHNWFIFIMAVLTAFVTALYTSRMIFMVFHGKNRGAHIHKPKWIMRSTLGVLAILVVVTAFFIEGSLADFLKEGIKKPTVAVHFDAVVFVSAFGAILLGVLLAFFLYGKGQTEVSFIANNKILLALRNFIANGYYIDHFYNAVFVKPVFWIGEKLSYLHTGKINWNMVASGAVAIGVGIALVVML